MASRLGIELSPETCRIVEIDARSRRAPAGETRVRSYAVLPTGGTEFFEKLAAFRRREAAVVVWGTRSVHHRVFVPERGYEQMRTDALALARDAGAGTDGMLADIVPSGAPQKGNRPVLLAMGSAEELSLAVQPLLDAGVRVRSVTTPASALTSLARTRREIASSEEIEAYIALEAGATALALVRDGSLVAARELAWGFLDDARPTSPRSRQEIATRLIQEIAGLGATIAVASPSIGQMSICGALPELRSLAALMTERIDLEVEPLDSLFGIDSAQLPHPSDEFCERSAELRLAWAVVAAWPTPINLMRPRQRQAARARLARAAVVAGVGVGLGAGWLIARDWRLQSTGGVARAASSRPVAQVIAPPPQSKPQSEPQSKSLPPPVKPPLPPPVAVIRATPPAPSPSPAAVTRATPPAPSPSPAAVTRATPPAPLPSPAPVARAVPLAPPAPLPPPRAVVTRPPLPPLLPLHVQTPPVLGPVAPVQPPSAQTSPAAAPRATPSAPLPAARPPQSVPAGPPPSSTPPVPTPHAPTVTRPPVATGEPTLAIARPRPPPTHVPERSAAAPTPFDAVLGTILYSADRRLAIIDGRIVSVGEEVKGARVIEITPNGVTLRDARGQLRTLALASAGP